MCLSKYYVACTYPRETIVSCPLKMLIGPSNEIHQGAPLIGTSNHSMKVIRLSYNGGALGVVPMDLHKI